MMMMKKGLAGGLIAALSLESQPRLGQAAGSMLKRFAISACGSQLRLRARSFMARISACKMMAQALWAHWDPAWRFLGKRQLLMISAISACEKGYQGVAVWSSLKRFAISACEKLALRSPRILWMVPQSWIAPQLG
jgi:hypothetical protein